MSIAAWATTPPPSPGTPSVFAENVLLARGFSNALTVLPPYALNGDVDREDFEVLDRHRSGERHPTNIRAVMHEWEKDKWTPWLLWSIRRREWRTGRPYTRQAAGKQSCHQRQSEREIENFSQLIDSFRGRLFSSALTKRRIPHDAVSCFLTLRGGSPNALLSTSPSYVLTFWTAAQYRPSPILRSTARAPADTPRSRSSPLRPISTSRWLPDP